MFPIDRSDGPRLRVLLLACVFAVALPSEVRGADQPATLEELRSAIQREVDDVGHGSAGVALVSRDEAIWTAGIGVADTETGRPADEHTYWRVGSITKSFVGLSALMLEERGAIRLSDPVAKWAPEIDIRNRWEDTDPVRLVHLLEHTAGFDDLRPKDYASNDPTPLTLRQALELVTTSLYCRWPPGRYMSYSNAGPAVAAYVMEKLDGRPFESIVADEIFEPLGMDGASLLLTDEVESRLAAGYDRFGNRVPYWHIAVRPSGALNASPVQMARFVRMLLNRGELDGRRLASPRAIERMERPETTLGSGSGLDYGYGLGNYSRAVNGFVFHGHNGGMAGYRAEYGYLPEEGLGYCVMVSASAPSALRRIRDLVRLFLVSEIERPVKPTIVGMPPGIGAWTGYYRELTPRNESSRFLRRLTGIVRIRREVDSLAIGNRRYVPVGARLFRREAQSMATLALLEGRDGRKFVQGERGNLRKVPAPLVWLQRTAAAAVVLLLVSSPVWALFWVPFKLFGRLKQRPVSVRVWPLLAIAVPCVAAFLMLGLLFGEESEIRFIEMIGRPSAIGIGLVVISWVFVLLSGFALLKTWKSDSARFGRFARVHSIAVSAACAIAAVYLLAHRAIGFPPWW